MGVTFSEKEFGVIAVAGHVGCGHSHSLNHQVQDDSAGLSVVLSLFKEACDVSMNVREVLVENHHTVVVRMENGGEGRADARRAITPQEERMMQSLVGKEVINTHSMVLDVFGRFYGQGVTETPVAVQAALANAALDGFLVNRPDRFFGTGEDVADNIGKIVGTVLTIDGIDTSVLATVNASSGGVGPVEDLEGNSNESENKRCILDRLHMQELPTLVVESMIYSSVSEGLTENTFLVRADEEDDNPYVRNAVVEAAGNLGVPVMARDGGMKRTEGALRKNTQKVADTIKHLAERLYQAETSEEKVQIVADLAVAVSEDCGGVTFMTNRVHEAIGGAGMLRRTSAVINLVTTEAYHQENPIPYMTEETCADYLALTKETIKVLARDANAAAKFIVS